MSVDAPAARPHHAGRPRRGRWRAWWLVAVALGAGCAVAPDPPRAAAPAAPPHAVIVVVWDGLRPDCVSEAATPQLARLRHEGVEFRDNHSTYPTFTMINAASFATGCFPGANGFFGNVLYAPATPDGTDADGRRVDFGAPVFAEDWGLLEQLDRSEPGGLLLAPTLFEAAHAAGLATAAVGKTGAAFLQDHRRGGFILDEKHVFPLAAALRLQADGCPLPKATPHAYPDGAIHLAAGEDPTRSAAVRRLQDGSGDPTDAGGSPHDALNAYLMHTFLHEVLPHDRPALSFVWLRSPDSTQHAYGPGTPDGLDALAAQDALLGELRSALDAQGLAATTDVIVVSDHGHSSVSGDMQLFPLRRIVAAPGGAAHQIELGPAGVDAAGFSASGDVRLADLLTRAGLPAFDGDGAANDPVLSGRVGADGTPVYPARTEPSGAAFVTPAFPLPRPLPPHAIVVAANGGSEFLYVPPGDDTPTVARAVRFLQSREEIGAIFVASRHGELPGTLPLAAVGLEGPATATRCPDVIASYAWNADAVVAGLRGIEYESAMNQRGMHGSFSPIDVHNVLIAFGPDFRNGVPDELPTGNVDLAPTLAHILGLPLPAAQGRVLEEALADGGARATDFDLRAEVRTSPTEATGLLMQRPTDPDGHDIDPSASRYAVELHSKLLRRGSREFRYFDWARGVRSP